MIITLTSNHITLKNMDTFTFMSENCSEGFYRMEDEPKLNIKEFNDFEYIDEHRELMSYFIIYLLFWGHVFVITIWLFAYIYDIYDERRYQERIDQERRER